MHVLLWLFSVTVLQFCTFIEFLEMILQYYYYTEEPLLSGHPREGKGSRLIFFFTFIELSRPTTGFRCSVNFLQKVFRFSFISCCANSTLPTFFSNFWEFFCRHFNQDVVLKSCLYSSLEKYYFQSLLNGVFINKKRQPSDLKRTCLLLLKGCIWEKCFLLYLRTEQPVTCDLRPVTCYLRPVTCG